MIREQTRAMSRSYSAMVKPTDRASMDVATPCTSRAPRPSLGAASSSPPPRMPSMSIFPPMKPSRARAIQGISFSKARKYCTMVWTQIHPVMGIRAWKAANTPAMPSIRRRDMWGSLRPLARDTENASIASPIPSSTLLKKNRIFHCMFVSPFFVKIP